jgi:hypothetical protein
MCWGEMGWDNYRRKIKEMEGEGWVFIFFPFSKGIIIGYGELNEYRGHVIKKS